jgi:DNA-binding transcriptional LysR family regulator
MEFSIRHLRAFLAVVNHGSVNQAAATLFRAQSAITRSIHERELGLDLFERRRVRRVDAEMQAARKQLTAGAGRKSRIRNAPIFSLFVTGQRLQAFVALTEQHRGEHRHPVVRALAERRAPDRGRRPARAACHLAVLRGVLLEDDMR